MRYVRATRAGQLLESPPVLQYVEHFRLKRRILTCCGVVSTRTSVVKTGSDPFLRGIAHVGDFRPLFLGIRALGPEEALGVGALQLGSAIALTNSASGQQAETETPGPQIAAVRASPTEARSPTSDADCSRTLSTLERARFKQVALATDGNSAIRQGLLLSHDQELGRRRRADRARCPQCAASCKDCSDSVWVLPQRPQP